MSAYPEPYPPQQPPSSPYSSNPKESPTPNQGGFTQRDEPPPYSSQQQTAYTPQAQAYPPQAQAYPPQPQAYPSQPQAYPSQTQAYPPQPQAYLPQTQGQATVIVQPQHYPQRVVISRSPDEIGMGALVFSIIATFWSLLFGGWLGLFCTIPAIVLAMKARGAASRADYGQAKTKEMISIILSVVSMIAWFFTLSAIIVGASVGSATAQRNEFFNRFG